MENSELSIVLSIVTVGLLTIYWKFNHGETIHEKFCRIPQGPYAWPIVGNLLQMGSRPYIALFNWSKTYGPIFQARLGSQNVVVLNGTDIIREALFIHAEEFAGRPHLYMTHATLKGKGIISSPYNTDYNEHKKFLLTSFNRFGRRRSSLEVSCLHSIRETLDEYREHTDEIILSTSAQLKNKLSQIASQNVLTMTFGVQIHDKPKFSKLMDLISANFQNTGVAAAYNFLPFTRIFQSSIMTNVLKCSEFLNAMITQRIEREHDNYDESFEQHNIIDAYLNELKNNIGGGLPEVKKSSGKFNSEDITGEENVPRPRGRYKSFSFDHLNSIVQDLFVAGTETIANTLNWAIIYAAYFPQFQQKLHDEIDKHIGRERAPCETDRRELNYVEAFMNETLRFHCAGPILIPRSTTIDTTLKGYRIPANTFILVNMWSCMRDEAYWDEPNIFNPGRFIDETGAFSCKNPAMMPFSVGTRACIGETLARSELFVIFTSILQKFKFRFASEEALKNPNLLDGCPGITLNPPNVSLRVELR